MRVVRQILVGLGLIVIGVGGVVLAQGIVFLTGSRPAMVEAVAIIILGALLLAGGVMLLVKGSSGRRAELAGG